MEISCRICESKELIEFFVGDIPLIRCKNCGIVYNKKMPSNEFLKEYYKDRYNISETDSKGFEKRRIFRFPEQIDLVSKIMEYKNPSATLLDIGCDRGFFLDEARRFGFKPVGIEPLEEARHYCNSIGLEVYDDIERVIGTFDIITMWHSLEHHLTPVSSLNRIKNLLKNDGFVFVRVPAFDCLWRKLFGKKWIWFQPENHYFHYTIGSLKNLLEISGFTVLKIEHRKPNNRLTKSYNNLSNKTFKKFFKHRTSKKSELSRIYQDITGVEIYAAAVKKQ